MNLNRQLELIDEFFGEDIIDPAWEGKNGDWIAMSDSDGDYYCCSRCGEELPRYSLEKATYDNPFPQYYSIEKTNFCPNCGADMRGERR